jgi:hypothetical protein
MCVWVWVDVHALGDAMHGWKRQDAEGGRLDGAVGYGRRWGVLGRGMVVRAGSRRQACQGSSRRGR